MKKYEEKEIVKIDRVLTKVVCDTCKKEIEANKFYYQVTTGHNDWGNDSLESIENKDICSDECLTEEFKKYIELESDTKYIEINKNFNKIENS